MNVVRVERGDINKLNSKLNIGSGWFAGQKGVVCHQQQ